MKNTKVCDLVVKWSENFVRFEFFMRIAIQIGQICEILSHSVRYGMYAESFDTAKCMNRQ